MTITQTELDHFHHFATHFLASANRELNLEQLVREWQAECEQAATIDAIRRGVADAENGRVSDLADVDERIRAELRFPSRGR